MAGSINKPAEARLQTFLLLIVIKGNETSTYDVQVLGEQEQHK